MALTPFPDAPAFLPGAAPTAPASQTSKASKSPGEEPAPSHHPPKVVPAYAYLLAWFMLGVILTLLNRTKLGHAVIYYCLILLIFFVLVSNYRFIASSLRPLQADSAS